MKLNNLLIQSTNRKYGKVLIHNINYFSKKNAKFKVFHYIFYNFSIILLFSFFLLILEAFQLFDKLIFLKFFLFG